MQLFHNKWNRTWFGIFLLLFTEKVEDSRHRRWKWCDGCNIDIRKL